MNSALEVEQQDISKALYENLNQCKGNSFSSWGVLQDTIFVLAQDIFVHLAALFLGMQLAIARFSLSVCLFPIINIRQVQDGIDQLAVVAAHMIAMICLPLLSLVHSAHVLQKPLKEASSIFFAHNVEKAYFNPRFQYRIQNEQTKLYKEYQTTPHPFYTRVAVVRVSLLDGALTAFNCMIMSAELTHCIVQHVMGRMFFEGYSLKYAIQLLTPLAYTVTFLVLVPLKCALHIIHGLYSPFAMCSMGKNLAEED